MLVAIVISTDRNNSILGLCMREIFHPVMGSDFLILQDFLLEECFENVQDTSLVMLRGPCAVIVVLI